MANWLRFEIALLTALTVAISSRAAAGQEAFRPVGSLSCNSTACHGNEPLDIKVPRKTEEFSRWMYADPHQNAARTLASEKYRDILVRTSNRDDNQADPKILARCAKCHDPLSGTGDHSTVSEFGHGIGCESCHGNAEKWLARHYERDISRPELAELGMFDTKDLRTRGQQCASCHVGSADRDMDHDMIAAGHPPLRFELSAYHDLIPNKHWNDNRERLEKRDFQVQLWAAGQTAAATARMELLAARSTPAKPNWPELAESNCFSCHATIRGQGQGTINRVGRPQWSPWNLTFVADNSSLTSLRELFRNDFAPAQIQTAKLSKEAKQQLQESLTSQEVTSRAALTMVTKSLDSNTADWESRCQQYLALTAVERAERDELAKARYYAVISDAEYNRRSAEQRELIAGLAQVRTWLEFEPQSAKKVLLDEPLRFQEKRAEIGAELRQITDRLHQQTQNRK
ncbi:multiheme c-type cytochrome [Anatilimnocola floriformis]|uniref:multiheme c-type cytochrome n=1 Tax=Anatilimnocola floriformis TaxID=2948575 RepID=UPI0020C22F56|nr:multiheme c-type cytochrome [Anatilimnocola floriformis]